MRFFATPLILLILSAVSIPVTASSVPKWLAGTWKSNEEKTLEDMRKHPEITEKAKKLFTNHFFGRLVIIYKNEEAAWYLIGDNPEKLEFIRYQAFPSGNNSVTFKFFDKTFGEKAGSTIYRDGDCYYMFTSKWKFKEYFCRYKR